jgi:phage minor structural protein
VVVLVILPRLYKAGTIDFSNNGLGVITEAVDCTVTQGLGSSVLEMKYPISGKFFEKLQWGTIIFAQPEPDAEPQPYSVYRIKKLNGGLVYIYARHVCYDLDGYIVAPFDCTSLKDALAVIKNATLGKSTLEYPFSFSTDHNGLGSFRLSKPQDTWSLIGQGQNSLIARYGGEAVFDKYNLHITTKRGKDRGVSVVYGYNLISLTQEENFSKSYTGILAYYGSASGTATRTVKLAPGHYPFQRLLPVDFTNELTGNLSPSGLDEVADRYMATHDVAAPKLSVSVQFSTLRTTNQYENYQKLEKVSMGDTVRIYHPVLGINVSARVAKTVYDCLLGKYKSVNIGNEFENVADVIVSQQRQIDNISV